MTASVWCRQSFTGSLCLTSQCFVTRVCLVWGGLLGCALSKYSDVFFFSHAVCLWHGPSKKLDYQNLTHLEQSNNFHSPSGWFKSWQREVLLGFDVDTWTTGRAGRLDFQGLHIPCRRRRSTVHNKMHTPSVTAPMKILTINSPQENSNRFPPTVRKPPVRCSAVAKWSLWYILLLL